MNDVTLVAFSDELQKIAGFKDLAYGALKKVAPSVRKAHGVLGGVEQQAARMGQEAAQLASKGNSVAHRAQRSMGSSASEAAERIGEEYSNALRSGSKPTQWLHKKLAPVSQRSGMSVSRKAERQMLGAIDEGVEAGKGQFRAGASARSQAARERAMAAAREAPASTIPGATRSEVLRAGGEETARLRAARARNPNNTPYWDRGGHDSRLAWGN